jgi:hypothetical protein
MSCLAWAGLTLGCSEGTTVTVSADAGTDLRADPDGPDGPSAEPPPRLDATADLTSPQHPDAPDMTTEESADAPVVLDAPRPIDVPRGDADTVLPACTSAAGFIPIGACLWADPPLAKDPSGDLNLAVDIAGILKPATRPTSASLVSYGPGCGSELADTFFSVEEAGGRRWTIGYSLGARSDAGPTLASLAGAPVTVSYRLRHGFGFASGFVLNDERRVVMMLENGRFGRAFRPADLAGLEVLQGIGTCERASICGREEDTTLVFAGGNHIEVQAGEQGGLRLGLGRYVARNLCSLRVADPHCSDYSPVVEWAIWRADLSTEPPTTNGCACGKDRVCPAGAIYSNGCAVCQCQANGQENCQVPACPFNDAGISDSPPRCEHDPNGCGGGTGSCIFDQGCESPRAYCAGTKCSHTFGEQQFCGCDGITFSTDCPRKPYRHVGACSSN